MLFDALVLQGPFCCADIVQESSLLRGKACIWRQLSKIEIPYDAQLLRLSPAQEEQLLQLRTKHLRNLRSLFEDRQRLNLSVSPVSGQLGLASSV